MAYKKIGVFGSTGRLGKEVTRALVEEGFEVVPFSRSASSQTIAGVQTQQITPETSLVGFDVIVSTVGASGWESQIPLIARAKADGVKRFIPCEFGMDHRGQQVDYLAPKENALKAVQEARFPDGWTAFINGFFETVVSIMTKLELSTNTLKVVGKGTKEYPFVFRHDIGRAIAQTFKAPPETYKDSWIVLASAWASGNQLAQWIEEAVGKKLTVEHVEPDASTPIISLLEKTDGNVFERGIETKGLGIEWDDFEAYVKSLVK